MIPHITQIEIYFFKKYQRSIKTITELALRHVASGGGGADSH